ncbi:hypothetical protein [Pseudomonas putida]|uniref:hypothetical protein n=1 Tax=Pseudomonas putida TaxID=303 RepID=UPI0008194891|nr:hypothetical protein [Pseudomonas putida]OCT23949.1 hypothetical protein A6E23_13565 [Pseudomonas putida]OCT27028.1 hypothetical protein A6E20_06525 [Pseudomonas putida]OCT28312.1 hypothetical protein A6E24_06340 [Pseudomonas putida]OCT38453.1 hypothetical protein A6E19_14955 [Pseudomonas putida]
MNNPAKITPLGIIAIFASVIEASAIASLPFLNPESQVMYTWFLIGFPFFLTVLFFLTLNFNYESLYTPEHRAVHRSADDHGEGEAATATTLFGSDVRQTIETEILPELIKSPQRERRWTLYNLSAHSCIQLSVRAIKKGEKVAL